MHFAYRWIFPVLSCVPFIFGIVAYCTTSHPADNGGAAMAVAFFFYPISLLLAIASAVITRSRRQVWRVLDRRIGYAPLCFLVVVALGVLVLALFH